MRLRSLAALFVVLACSKSARTDINPDLVTPSLDASEVFNDVVTDSRIRARCRSCWGLFGGPPPPIGTCANDWVCCRREFIRPGGVEQPERCGVVPISCRPAEDCLDGGIVDDLGE
jgi:hypothetical protein